MRRRRTRLLALELLDRRQALSVTIVNPTTATFIDIDGDLATVKVSAGTLTAGLFTTAAKGLGDQLQEINLGGGGFDGTSLTVTAKKIATGDGLVNVGFIDSAGHDLGAVSVSARLVGNDKVGSNVGPRRDCVKIFGWRSRLGERDGDQEPGQSRVALL